MDAETKALIERLEQRIAELEGLLQQRDARIAELEQAAFRQAAPFRRRDPLKVDPAQKKKPGRPPGHPGAFRAVPAVIDETVDVSLSGCPGCGGPLGRRAGISQPGSAN
jgi:hypothetical protein